MFPDKPVKPGDTWTHTSESDLGGGQTLTLETQYEYVGTEERGGQTLDKIKSKATSVSYAMEPNASSPLKIKSSELKIASSEGTILVLWQVNDLELEQAEPVLRAICSSFEVETD